MEPLGEPEAASLKNKSVGVVHVHPPVSVITALPFGRRYAQQHGTKQLLPGWPPAIEFQIQHVVWLAWRAFKCPAAMKAGHFTEIHFAHGHVSGRVHLLPQPDGHVKMTELQVVVREAQDAGLKVLRALCGGRRRDASPCS